MVYLVEDEFKKRYALKAIKNSNDKKRLKSEISILQEVNNHKNIIKFYKTIKVDRRYFLLFEYAENGDLETLVKNNGCLSDDRTFDILNKIIDALKFAHSKNIIHTDIKPDNIFINKNEYYLGDWSISNQKEEVKLVHINTDDCYTSPECYSGNFNKSIDIYSLGCTLYYLTTGRKVYDFDNSSSFAYIMYAHCMLGIDFELISSNKLKYLIYRMTDKNPHSRATIDEINEILIINSDILFTQKYGTNYEKYKNMNSTELYEIMSDKNIPFAMNNLGIICENKKSNINIDKAFSFYSKASNLGFTVSIFNLALCHLKGKGVEKDYKKAFELFVKSSSNGHAKSIYYLANLYENGMGVETNMTKAIKLYEVSAFNGFKDSYIKLKELLKSDKKL